MQPARHPALYSILRYIARHVRGFFAALAAFVTVSMAVAVAAVALFTAIAGGVRRGWTQDFDDAVLRWLQLHRSPALDKFMLEMTVLGSGSVLIVMVITASLFLWLTKHHWSVYVLAFGLVGGEVLNSVLKAWFDRPRPTSVLWLTQVTSFSFPSGHAMESMIAYGSIAYLIGRLEPTLLLRRVTWGVAIIIVGLIGFSRMYLGVHYPSDVIAGYLIGIAWVGLVAATIEAVAYFAKRRPVTHAEEHDLPAGASRKT